MEIPSLSFRPTDRIYGAPPANRLATDAWNLVRDWFRRQMPQT